MADNVIIPVQGTGDSTPTIAADDIGGVKHQRVKVEYGADGSATDVSSGTPLPVGGSGIGTGGFAPTPAFSDADASPGDILSLKMDTGGNLAIRGQALTDEGSFSTDFPGASLTTALSGTLTFTAAGLTVTGSGTAFTTEIGRGQYIKLNSDGESAWTAVRSVDSDTQITLYVGYQGSSGSGASSKSPFETLTGSGGSITVGSSAITIGSGTTSTARTQIERNIDYYPLSVTVRDLSVSQRIANQQIYFGVFDNENPGSAVSAAYVLFDGATATTAKLITQTSSSASDQLTNSFTLPAGATSATAARWKLVILPDSVRLYWNDILAAVNYTHIPMLYVGLNYAAGCYNTGAAGSNTNLIIGEVLLNNFDLLNMGGVIDSAGIVNIPQIGQDIPAASATSATTLFQSDASHFTGIIVQVTSAGTTCTITYEQSLDGTNWVACAGYAIGSTGSAAPVTTSTAAGMMYFPLNAKYFRARVSTYTSGTVTALGHMTAQPASLLSMGVNVGAGTITTVTTCSTLTSITNWGNIVDNAAFTDGTTRLSPSGYIFDETAGTALTENDAAAARVDSKRAQVLVIEDETTRGQRTTVNSSKGLAVTPIPHTSGGLSIYHLISAATTNAANVKASAGQIYGWAVSNASTGWRYIKLHNVATTPTAGAGVVQTIAIPPGGGSNIELPHGIAFATGIGITIVTGIADSDATAVGASEVSVDLFYK